MAPLPIRAHPLFHRASSPSSVAFQLRAGPPTATGSSSSSSSKGNRDGSEARSCFDSDYSPATSSDNPTTTTSSFWATTANPIPSPAFSQLQTTNWLDSSNGVRKDLNNPADNKNNNHTNNGDVTAGSDRNMEHNHPTLTEGELKAKEVERDALQGDIDLQKTLYTTTDRKADPAYAEELVLRIKDLEKRRNILSKEIDQARKKPFSSSIATSAAKHQMSIPFSLSSSTLSSGQSPASSSNNTSTPSSNQGYGYRHSPNKVGDPGSSPTQQLQRSPPSNKIPGASPHRRSPYGHYPTNQGRSDLSPTQRTQRSPTKQAPQSQRYQPAGMTPSANTTYFMNHDNAMQGGGFEMARSINPGQTSGLKRPYHSLEGASYQLNTDYRQTQRRKPSPPVIDLTEDDGAFVSPAGYGSYGFAGNPLQTPNDQSATAMYDGSRGSASGYGVQSSGAPHHAGGAYGAGGFGHGTTSQDVSGSGISGSGTAGNVIPGNPSYHSNAISANYDAFPNFGKHSHQLHHQPSYLSGNPMHADQGNKTVRFDQGLAELARKTAGYLQEEGGEELMRMLGMGEPSLDVKKGIDDILTNITPRSADGSVEPRHDTPVQMKNELYEHQKIALRWMLHCEKGKHRGGILADDMGLGKTISALALIASNQADINQVEKRGAPKTTLIVGPVAIVRQWKQEVKDKIRATHKLSVFLYHGTDKKKMKFDDLRNYDVVLTTYGVLSAEYKRLDSHMVKNKLAWADTQNDQYIQKNCPLLHFKSKWYRVILDESQCVKNRFAQCTKAVQQLSSTYRWCMTGTPMMNNVLELYSLVAFLRIGPYNVFDNFKRDFKCLWDKGTNYQRERGMKKLQALLASIMMRRTKKSTIDGKPIITLPEKHEESVHVVFDQDEDRYYHGLQQHNADIFNKYNREGTVGKNYAVVLVLLLRLRQACCHPHLNTDVEPAPVDTDLKAQLVQVHKITDEAREAIKFGVNNDAFLCTSCNDVAPTPIFFSPCGHAVCEGCVSDLRENKDADNIRKGLDGDDSFACPSCKLRLHLRNNFRLAAFKTAFMPEMMNNSEREVVDDSDSDSDDDDEIPIKDEVDDKGNLKDFIVNDNVDEVPDTSESDTLATDMDELSALTNATTPESGGDGLYRPSDQADDEDEDEDAKVTIEDIEAELSIDATKAKSSSKAKSSLKPTVQKKARAKKSNRSKVSIKDVRATELGMLRKDAQKNKLAHAKYMKYLKKNWQPSAKVTKAVELIQQICEEKKEKVIVFSSFTGLLDLLEIPLRHEVGIKYGRFDGSMSGDVRDKTVTAFREDPNFKVLLVSLRAGNAGLNLTVANNVIILDPYWNPFIEMQAVDRTYRIGQTKNVRVHRILVKDTIEDRIIKLQNDKKELVEAALDESKTAKMSRLSVGELGYLFGVN